jgi:hypothetical protein
VRGVVPRVVIVATALGVLATAGTAAGDRIVPGRAIGPISVGDERAAIAARFGDGEVARRTPNPSAPGNRNLDAVVVRYPALSLVARFPTDEASSGVTRLSTRNPRYRTAAGVGVGSTRSAVRTAHPAAVCTPAACQVGRAGAGRTVTRYVLAPRVIRVEVLRVSIR